MPQSQLPTIFANLFLVGISVDSASITCASPAPLRFGGEDDPEQKVVYEQLVLISSLPALKALGKQIADRVTAYEDKFGEIDSSPFDPQEKEE